ncbi:MULTISPECIES: DUF397 domain-containing protein [Streptomyces]|uniref:DUF397 domain-containing protein n=1 Tax=Streptomyces TaxID=1883 RepID=UPI00101349FA|nr:MULTISPECIES: DUF397 domain-containing protein [Streptomyces]RZD82125.1 DUF397 domain-containing protein [Streptomyces albidoflavus]RZD96076.1 DUF397 domain-containing protein [Streptomyces albidoflavus]RZD98687.1 DUF397 domain-containing protein [Streptomyces albidoflavus]
MNHAENAATLPVTWWKSSRSEAGAQCVECAIVDPHQHIAALRDSKNPTGPALLLPYDTVNSFVTALKRGALK